MSDRLKPDNPGNARLMFIDSDDSECDVCDKVSPTACFETVGTGGIETILKICKSYLQETVNRFDE